MVDVHCNEGGDRSVDSSEVVIKEGPLGGAGGVVLVGGDEDGVDGADFVAVVEEVSGKLVGGSQPIPLRKKETKWTLKIFLCWSIHHTLVTFEGICSSNET